MKYLKRKKERIVIAFLFDKNRQAMKYIERQKMIILLKIGQELKNK